MLVPTLAGLQTNRAPSVRSATALQETVYPLAPNWNANVLNGSVISDCAALAEHIFQVCSSSRRSVIRMESSDSWALLTRASATRSGLLACVSLN